MPKPISRSDQLIAAMHEAALKALSAAPGGQMLRVDLLQAIESSIPLDEWAKELYDNGNARWKSIFGFASVGLFKGGYITKEGSTWSITDQGRSVVSGHYDGAAFLKEVNKRYRLWKESQLLPAPANQASNQDVDDADDEALEAPEIRMARILKIAHEALAAELIEITKQSTPAFFEHLVLQLLLRMGYGSSRHDAGKTVGQSGDGGIDGVINEDQLGLDTIYLQAKRWKDPVGEGPIRDFIGALDIKGVKKGVFLTTSYYTPAAKLAVQSIKSDKKIVLIDGARLAELMIENNLGVSTSEVFSLKRLDSDFFTED
jgi:restriction system protein